MNLPRLSFSLQTVVSITYLSLLHVRVGELDKMEEVSNGIGLEEAPHHARAIWRERMNE